MKKSTIAVLGIAAGLVFSGSAMAADQGAKAAPAGQQQKCPVMGGAIDSKVYTDFEGKRVYFCCSSCKGQFEADPQKYMKKLGQ